MTDQLGLFSMPSEYRDQLGKELYLRPVPKKPEVLAQADFGPSDRSGFSNSSINRDAYRFADRPNTRDFDTMLADYMWSGGIARHQEVASRLEEAYAGSRLSLQALINSNAAFAFDWRGSLWLPMFQFKQPDMYVNPSSRKVLVELAGVFDGWSMAVWYLQQNSWLGNRRPIDCLEPHPTAVLLAARGDRFIATNSLQRIQ
jgi:hypothetical protein